MLDVYFAFMIKYLGNNVGTIKKITAIINIEMAAQSGKSADLPIMSLAINKVAKIHANSNHTYVSTEEMTLAIVIPGIFMSLYNCVTGGRATNI